MAKTIHGRIKDGEIVGTFVYESYTPSRCGFVTQDLGVTSGGYFHMLRVKYHDGVEKTIDSGQLKDFEELIADHKRKYENHLAKLDKLKQLKDSA